MFNSVMFAHDFVQTVTIETSHKQEYHARALPPLVVLAVLREQKSCGEAQSDGLPCAGSLEPDHLPQTVSERENGQKIEEGDRAVRVVIVLDVTVSQILEKTNRIEGQHGHCYTLESVW